MEGQGGEVGRNSQPTLASTEEGGRTDADEVGIAQANIAQTNAPEKAALAPKEGRAVDVWEWQYKRPIPKWNGVGMAT